MQTFLPSPSFLHSASVLDDKRLGKQRVECLQILNALHDPSYGWQNHPAVKMWRGYEQALVRYSLYVCAQWQRRGFNDTCYDKIRKFCDESPTVLMPPWLGDADFHRSHQSNLIRKKPEHYVPLFPDVPNNLPYIWPK